MNTKDRKALTAAAKLIARSLAILNPINNAINPGDLRTIPILNDATETLTSAGDELRQALLA